LSLDWKTAAIAQGALPLAGNPAFQTSRLAMSAVFPFYTSIYAAVLGLLAALLTVNVIANRVRAQVDVGDGGVASLAQAIRAHGNFAEHAPLALLLIGLVEAFAYRSVVVNGLGVVLLAGRFLSAWGLNSSLKQTFGRQSGATLTILVIAVSAALILYAAIPH
jgi:uncharacterized protein